VHNYGRSKFSEFRKGLKGYLDSVENDNKMLIIKRKTGKDSVWISLGEYNSIQETLQVCRYETLQNDMTTQLLRLMQISTCWKMYAVIRQKLYYLLLQTPRLNTSLTYSLRNWQKSSCSSQNIIEAS
jgi:PHD/YefM family antitoxin component YafN of YafNO toxin-antitoxin module